MTATCPPWPPRSSRPASRRRRLCRPFRSTAGSACRAASTSTTINWRGAGWAAAQRTGGRGTVTGEDAARAWLDRAERPFFLWVHLFEPHAPYGIPRRRRRAARYATTRWPTADRAAGRLLDALGDARVHAGRRHRRSRRGLRRAWRDRPQHLRVRHDAASAVLDDRPRPGDATARSTSRCRWSMSRRRRSRGSASPDWTPTASISRGLIDGPRRLRIGRSTPSRLRRSSTSGGARCAASARGGGNTSPPRSRSCTTSIADPAEMTNVRVDLPQRAPRSCVARVERSRRPDAAGAARLTDQRPLARLRALGYLGGGPGASRAGSSRPDPKDRIELASRIATVTSGELTRLAELVATLEAILARRSGGIRRRICVWAMPSSNGPVRAGRAAFRA